MRRKKAKTSHPENMKTIEKCKVNIDMIKKRLSNSQKSKSMVFSKLVRKFLSMVSQRREFLHTQSAFRRPKRARQRTKLKFRWKFQLKRKPYWKSIDRMWAATQRAIWSTSSKTLYYTVSTFYVKWIIRKSRRRQRCYTTYVTTITRQIQEGRSICCL